MTLIALAGSPWACAPRAQATNAPAALPQVQVMNAVSRDVVDWQGYTAAWSPPTRW
ncbi:hypothetical protein CSV86_029060 [Pseudomonas putida CSV86]|uniref:Uncharacterized protein n=1 Tax=Pseudomonas bharatica CSV86 TaxID=1005395 RepID=A0A7K4EMS0_9PSED|nr:hypothetical protein [Pseudomonas bharatica]NNJ18925.1 hypothetical protein [Pseudomonas bharatica CSV86]